MTDAAREGAVATLIDVFEHPLEHARRRAGGARLVATSWPTVPSELVAAAGCWPFVIRADPRTTPLADTRLEPGVFSSRVRTLIELALGGGLDFVEALIVPRTSEQDYKAYLYLREFHRQQAAVGTLPPVHLFDLLQSDSPESYQYGLDRLRVLAGQLETLSGVPITTGALAQAIAASNRARQAARALLAQRLPRPRVSGAEAMAVLGAFWLMPHEEYAVLARRAAAELQARDVLPGPRLLFAGAPLDHSILHRQVEALGATVVAEDTPWGSRALGRDVDSAADPFAALFAKYFDDAASPRTPVAAARKWFERAVSDGIDGVVVVLPDDDSVFGWDYPAQRQLLDRRGIPHVMLRGDGVRLDADDRARLSSMISQASQRAGVSHA